MNTDRRFVNRRERSIGDKFWAAFVRQGRRKSDPPKLFEPAPIAVGVLLLVILVGAVLLTGCGKPEREAIRPTGTTVFVATATVRDWRVVAQEVEKQIDELEAELEKLK